ncbi:hypothetical protein PIB30_042253 [Stylosanthes scabra]|uniref:Uncharacterized protein n=1 Tax=Stylosanthes scabra TaxID=79078 RepID=A0ABU6RFR7_9FABA|nr:hypothetical protein [Stylosanthes scabra]
MLDPLETLAFEFLQSLPAGLGKKYNFKCRWILDHNNTDVGTFLDSLLKDMEKQSRFDRLMQKMKEAEGVGPRSILPSSRAQTAASGASASGPVASAFTPATSVPPAPSTSAPKAGGKPTNATAARPFSMEREEGAREDLAADLRQKRRKGKVSEASAEEAALGVTLLGSISSGATSSDCSFPTACLQELATTKDQVDVLTAEMNSALAAPLLHAKIKSLSEELERAEGKRLSAFDRMKEVEERAKVQVAELESCCSALAKERKNVDSLTQSLKGKQTALDEAEAAAVRHLNLAIDYSMITLDTRWDPKAKRIYNPKAETQGQPEPVVVDRPKHVAKEQPKVLPEQQMEEVVAGEGGGCPI